MPFDHQAHQLPAPLIHIGFSKALSSWLQKHFFKPEQGFIRILDSLTTTISIIDPTPFAFDEQQCHAFIDDFLAKQPERQRHGQSLTPIVSAEALIGNAYCGGYNAKQNADRIKQMFPDARILLIVREQQRLIRSLYKTMITWGMPHSIKRLLSPVDTSMAPQFNLDYLRFDLAVAYYQQLFGPENVLVLPYEAFAENPQAFLLRILEHVGMQPTERFSKLPMQKRLNSNQTLLNLYLQRLHNYWFLASPFNYSGLLPSTEARTMKRLARSKRNPFPAWLDNLFESSFRKTVQEKFTGQFAASNQRLSELTGLDLARYGYELPTLPANPPHKEPRP